MTPEGAKAVLDQMGVTEQAGPNGEFRITRPPSNHNLAMFVKAVRTLGERSVGTIAECSQVHYSTDQITGEVVFKIKPRWESGREQVKAVGG
jgi:hypothetical protein